jgi:threonine synthase
VSARLPRYRCGGCGRLIDPAVQVWRCPACGGLLVLEPAGASFPLASIRDRPTTLWRYREALPFDAGSDAPGRVTMGEGFTPVVTVTLGDAPVLAKVEFASPTLSFKDRGAAVLIAAAVELGATEVVADSSGNAGAAIAAYAARAGLAATVFVAATASPVKLAQIAAHGAEARTVDGDRESVGRAAREEVESRGAFYASHVHNPYFHQGTKTFVFEVWEQLGGRMPDVLVLPVGNGTLLLGAWLGLGELYSAEAISAVPRLVAVQAAGCAPVAQAWALGAGDVEPVVGAGTVAEGIAIAAPARGAEILAAVRDSGGEVVTITDEEIVAAGRELAGQGLYLEPTAAATAAGARRWIEQQGAGGADVLIPLCGAGLKGAAATTQVH